MRVLLVGAGSIGLLMAGRLARGSTEVHLICRSSRQAAAIAADGITLTSLDGTEQTVRVASAASFEASTANAALPEQSRETGSDWSWILLTVKQKDIDSTLIHWLKEQMSEETGLVCFQNGIGHIERLAKKLPHSRLFTAVTTEGAKRQSCNEVSQTGQGTIWIGKALMESNERSPHTNDGSRNIMGNLREKEIEALLQALRESGMDARGDRYIIKRVWDKLIINAVINPLTAISGVKNGELLMDSDRRANARKLYEEAKNIAVSLGIPTSETLWEQIEQICKLTSGNHSSMLQDRMERRVTEIDWINGHLVKLAHENQIPCPQNESVVRQMKAIEKQYAVVESREPDSLTNR